ncbi:hypothetical protein THASP1DRAFT_33699, partial [Thamnocephalis sphaerospora]
STVHQVLSLQEPNSRRLTGGKLEVTLRLRTPLLGADIADHQERWLFLEEAASASSSPAQVATPAAPSLPAATTPQPPRAQHASAASAAASAPPTPASQAGKAAGGGEAPVVATPPKPPTDATGTADTADVLEKTLAEFDSVDSIASNLVLEKEQERLQALLLANPRNSDETRDRLQAVQIKLNLLVVQVQTGTLTLAAYIADVRRCIDRTKQQALLFKRAGRSDKAREALARLRIMQEEVAEVEQAGLL